ncbi:MAG TPA: WD40 repeat domain-containing protein [Candidatus Brocadiia bacterium]|nr:WD40 repeat domain-containing protein [Candidatus Brocadiia bacterium]
MQANMPRTPELWSHPIPTRLVGFDIAARNGWCIFAEDTREVSVLDDGGDLQWSCSTNGRPLQVLAVPDGSLFAIMEAGGLIRCLGPDGAQRWKVDGPQDACRMALSEDGSLLAVACGLSCLHVYRTAQANTAKFPLPDPASDVTLIDGKNPRPVVIHEDGNLRVLGLDGAVVWEKQIQGNPVKAQTANRYREIFVTTYMNGIHVFNLDGGARGVYDPGHPLRCAKVSEDGQCLALCNEENTIQIMNRKAEVIWSHCFGATVTDFAYDARRRALYIAFDGRGLHCLSLPSGAKSEASPTEPPPRKAGLEIKVDSAPIEAKPVPAERKALKLELASELMESPLIHEDEEPSEPEGEPDDKTEQPRPGFKLALETDEDAVDDLEVESESEAEQEDKVSPSDGEGGGFRVADPSATVTAQASAPETVGQTPAPTQWRARLQSAEFGPESLQVSPGGDYVGMVSTRGVLELLNATGQAIARGTVQGGNPRLICATDRPLMMAYTEAGCLFYDCGTGVHGRFVADKRRILGMRLSGNGKVFLLWDSDNRIAWGTIAGDRLWRRHVKAGILRAALSPDGSTICVVDAEGRIRIFDSEGKLRRKFRMSGGERYHQLDISETVHVYGGERGCVLITDCNGDRLFRKTICPGGVLSVKRIGSFYEIHGKDRMIHLLCEDGKRRAKFDARAGSRIVRISQSGEALLVNALARSVAIYKAGDPKPVWQFKAPNKIHRLGASADARVIAFLAGEHIYRAVWQNDA